MNLKVTNKQNNSKNCLICGLLNPLGLKARFYELENKTLVATCELKDHHQSYPGRGHGGIIAALLDETIGRAIMINDPTTWGVTIELSVKYRKPVPLNTPIKVFGRITEENRRLFFGNGEIVLPNGEIAAEATGKYMRMSLDKISDDHNFLENEWFKETNESDIKIIEINP